MYSRSGGLPPRQSTMLAASAVVTLPQYASSTLINGPALHSPRHPTPLTWHVSLRPRASTSCCSAAFTCSLPVDMQPAATQTRMVCW